MARTARLAHAVVLLAAWGAGGAGAGSTVPDDVDAWFAQEAAGTIRATVRDMVVVDPAEAPRRYTRVTVAEPRRLHLWSDELREGSASADPLVPSEEWIAPYTGDGEAAGAVVAWREDGSPTLAYFDDDAGLARALAKLPPGGQVVQEPVLGAHFALVGDEVTTLSPGRFESVASAPLAEFRVVLSEQLRAAEGVRADGATSRWWLPTALVVSAVALTVGAALLVRAAWRRTGQT